MMVVLRRKIPGYWACPMALAPLLARLGPEAMGELARYAARYTRAFPRATYRVPSIRSGYQLLFPWKISDDPPARLAGQWLC